MHCHKKAQEKTICHKKAHKAQIELDLFFVLYVLFVAKLDQWAKGPQWLYSP